MATNRQVTAAKQNVKKAQGAARKQRTIAHLDPATRRDLGRQAAASRARGGAAGHALEEPQPAAAVRAREAAEHQGALEDGQVGADRGAAPALIRVAPVRRRE